MNRNFDISKYAVVLPSLNPTEKLLGVIDGILEAGFGSIILIDDGSAPEFKEPFRTQKLWSMDWSEEGIKNDPPIDYKAPYEGLDSVNTKDRKPSDVD